jgi:hypothetical protein
MPWQDCLCELLETRQRGFSTQLPNLAEASQAKPYVLDFRTKSYLILVSMPSQQSVTAKALPVTQ